MHYVLSVSNLWILAVNILWFSIVLCRIQWVNILQPCRIVFGANRELQCVRLMKVQLGTVIRKLSAVLLRRKRYSYGCTTIQLWSFWISIQSLWAIAFSLTYSSTYHVSLIGHSPCQEDLRWAESLKLQRVMDDQILFFKNHVAQTNPVFSQHLLDTDANLSLATNCQWSKLYYIVHGKRAFCFIFCRFKQWAVQDKERKWLAKYVVIGWMTHNLFLLLTMVNHLGQSEALIRPLNKIQNIIAGSNVWAWSVQREFVLATLTKTVDVQVSGFRLPYTLVALWNRLLQSKMGWCGHMEKFKSFFKNHYSKLIKVQDLGVWGGMRWKDDSRVH